MSPSCFNRISSRVGKGTFNYSSPTPHLGPTLKLSDLLSIKHATRHLKKDKPIYHISTSSHIHPLILKYPYRLLDNSILFCLCHDETPIMTSFLVCSYDKMLNMNLIYNPVKDVNSQYQTCGRNPKNINSFFSSFQRLYFQVWFHWGSNPFHLPSSTSMFSSTNCYIYILNNSFYSAMLL